MATSSIHKRMVISEEQFKQINETPATKVDIPQYARKFVQMNDAEKTKLVLDVIKSRKMREKSQ